MSNRYSWYHEGTEYGIDTVHSTHDNGWYAEVWDMRGKKLHTTRVYRNDRAARRGAELWIEGHCLSPVKEVQS